MTKNVQLYHNILNFLDELVVQFNAVAFYQNLKFNQHVNKEINTTATINNQWACRWAITIKNSVCSQEINISMAHATTTLSYTFLPKIMPDKPWITQKLTNAWHLLNIHYSDTSSEFQKAERMLNQHSYSQSELQHHIAARLSADENGTLGPDSKKCFGYSSPGSCVYVCGNKREKSSSCFIGEGRFTLLCLSAFQTRMICLFFLLTLLH